MLPYFHLTTLTIGPLTIHVWGVFVSLAFIVGIILATHEVKRRRLDHHHIIAMTGWVLLSTFIGARLFHVFFYDWPYYVMHPYDIFKFWEGGLASFGGYIGATLAVLIYLRRHRLPILTWSDPLIFALPLGIAIGRIGPFLGHLHPGIHSNLFFAIQFPDGGRLDADLLLAINGLLLALVFFVLNRHRRRDGFFLTFFLLWYGITRFFLDSIRATDIAIPDARYLGLTPAQYGAIFFMVIGLLLAWKIRNEKQEGNLV